MGEEPDYRFTLANERTFLAWLRTALALLAGAVALSQFARPLALTGLGVGLTVLLALAGTVLAACAYRRWAKVQRAMRNAGPLPMTWLPFVVGLASTLVGVLVLLLALGLVH
ncbi:MAG TPA: DUF202 domain-containing protein [Pseudonocardia sp.]